MRSTARRMEEEFIGGLEEESRVVLWTNSTIGYRVVGVGMAQPRSRHHVLEMPKIWQRRMLCRR